MDQNLVPTICGVVVSSGVAHSRKRPNHWRHSLRIQRDPIPVNLGVVLLRKVASTPNDSQIERAEHSHILAHEVTAKPAKQEKRYYSNVGGNSSSGRHGIRTTNTNVGKNDTF